MALTKRLVKGSPLTLLEGDDNLDYLEGLGLSDLSDVLARGNTTGANDIVVSDGQTINAASGGGQLDLRYDNTDNTVMLSTDPDAYTYYTSEHLYMENGEVELYSLGDLVIGGADYTSGFGISTSPNTDYNCYGINGFVIKNNKLKTGQDAEMVLDHDSKINIGESTVDDIHIGLNSTVTTTIGTAVTVRPDKTVRLSSLEVGGHTINAASGGGQLDLRYGATDNQVMLSNDAGAYGEAILYLSNGYSSFSSNNGNDIDIYSSASATSVNGIFFEGTTDRSVLYSKGGQVDIGVGEPTSVSGLHISSNAVTSDNPINAASGTGQLDLRYGGDNQVMLSTDAGAYTEAFLNMEPGYTELSNYSTGGFGDNLLSFSTNGSYIEIGTPTSGTDQITIGSEGPLTMTSTALMQLNTAGNPFQVVVNTIAINVTTSTIELDATSLVIDRTTEVTTIKSLETTNPPKFPEFTVATLPSAVTYKAGQIMVTDEVGGYTPAFSDGTNWRRVTDRAIVS